MLRQRLVASLLSAGFASFSGVAMAQEPFVFSAFNQSALARHVALPAPAAAMPEQGSSVTLDWTSENVLERSASEDLRIDGESLRLGLGYRTRWQGMTWGVELPLLLTGGGVLDSSIETWHSWFGLPNGGRETIPRNQYRYRYVRNGTTVFDFGGSDRSLGDMRLSVADCSQGGGCWNLMLQLPTADGDRLLGGGLGLSTWFEQAYALDSARRWTGAMAMGGSAVRADGPMRDQQRQWIPFGWMSLGYALTDTLDLGAQFYGHGALYDSSALDAIRRPGGQLVFGFAYHGAVRWRFGFQEDVITNSSPDFVIHFDTDWG